MDEMIAPDFVDRSLCPAKSLIARDSSALWPSCFTREGWEQEDDITLK
jgi:hypothetical protein